MADEQKSSTEKACIDKIMDDLYEVVFYCL